MPNAYNKPITKIKLPDGENVAIRSDTYTDPYANLIFAILVRAGLDSRRIDTALYIKRSGNNENQRDADEFLKSDYAKSMLNYLKGAK